MSKSKKIKIVEKTGNTRNTVIDSSLLNQDVKSPSWRFNRWDKEFPIKHEREEAVGELLDHLSAYEKMTWGKIKLATGGKRIGTNSHYLKISDLSKAAQNRAREIKLYEDEVFSLRINGKHRLIGILEDGVFYVIWNDKEHDICASSKRNT